MSLIQQQKQSAMQNFKELKSKVNTEYQKQYQYKEYKNDNKNLATIVWVFRKCDTYESLHNQNFLFQDGEAFLVRHIVWHVQLLIQSNKFNDNQISRFMKSIGVQVHENKQDITDSQELEFEAIQNYSVDNMSLIELAVFQRFVNIWKEIKEVGTIKDECINKLTSKERDNIMLNWAEINVILNQVQEQYTAQKQQQRINTYNLEGFMFDQKAYDSQYQDDLLHTSKFIHRQTSKLSNTAINLTTQNRQNTKRCFRILYSDQIVKQPDGSIIQGMFSDKNVCLSYVVTWFNSTNIIKNFQENNQTSTQVKYNGNLNVYMEADGIGKQIEEKNEFETFNGQFYHGLKHGEGVEILQKYEKYEGKFANGYRHGIGKLKDLKNEIEGPFIMNKKCGQFRNTLTNQVLFFENDIQQQTYQKQKATIITDSNGIQHVLEQKENKNPQRQMYGILHHYLNNFQVRSLNYGKWLNQSVVDAYIALVIQHETLKRQYLKQQLANQLIINTSEFQDIFGSILGKDNQINRKVFDKLKNNRQYQRIVFVLNHDQGHFLAVVYENNKLYLLDSLQDGRQTLLWLINKLLFQGGNKPQIDWETKFPVSQQRNCYDCGIYTSYFAYKVITHQDKLLSQINNEFQVKQTVINQFRAHIRQVITGNYAQIGI